MTWPTASAWGHSLSAHADRMPNRTAVGTASRTVARPLVAVIVMNIIYTVGCRTSAPGCIPGRSVVHITVITPETSISCA